MEEIWRDIPNYEGYYQVSNLGRVKSVAKKVQGKSGSLRSLSEKILRISKDDKGYPIICLTKQSKRKTHAIHRLVAYAFLNHTPNGYKVIVDHKDNNPENSKLENLQLISPRLNSSKDRFRKKHTSKYVGVSHHPATNKWRAKIYLDKKQIHIGLFDTEEDARKAYLTTLKKHKPSKI
jgi:hypothetical protein